MYNVCLIDLNNQQHCKIEPSTYLFKDYSIDNVEVMSDVYVHVYDMLVTHISLTTCRNTKHILQNVLVTRIPIYL